MQAVEDVDPGGDDLPARQSMQAVEDVEPEGEALPAVQGLQAAEPDVAL